MAQATYFNTAKRRNSTLVPSLGTEATLHLKEATSLLNPTFLLSAETVPAISEILFMGRYYFVDNIRSVRQGIWEIDCSVDVLATYKSQILAQSAFVKYSSSINDPYVIDDRIQRQVKSTITLSGNSGTLDRYSDSPRYILQVIGTGGGSISGFTTSYLMTQSEISQLADLFFNDTELQTELEQYFANFFDCIIACYRTNWIPPTSGGADVMLGKYNTGISAELITTTKTRDVVFPTIPWPFDDFRRSDCALKIYLPYVGCVELSASEFYSQNELDIIIDTEWNTGNILYRVQGASGNETSGDIATFSGNCFAKVPVSQYGVQGGAAVSSLGGGIIGNLYTHTAQFLSNMGLEASIYEQAGYDMLRGISKSTPSLVGGFGGMAVGGVPSIACYCLYNPRAYEPSDATANDFYGRPYFRTISNISSLTGFLQCAGYSFSGNCTDRERVTINNLLNGGIYIE